MLFELPFSNPKGWTLQKVIFAAIIVVHATWIAFHLNLVSRGLVNPWKVGGYGMYTVPAPKPFLHVYDQLFIGIEAPISGASRANFRRNNHQFSFQCQPLTEYSLQVFFKENPQLIGHTLRFFVSQVKFLQNPISAARQMQSVLEVGWRDPETVQYTGQVCGKIYEGQLKLPK